MIVIAWEYKFFRVIVSAFLVNGQFDITHLTIVELVRTAAIEGFIRYE